MHILQIGARIYHITARFTDVKQTNAYLEKHPDEGVLLENKLHIYVAKNTDLGTQVARALS